ncbi:hypothetical protein K2173_020799 [Erythroxylum novogranatense]|uniref:F-box domain-containing protein n=1 Tax=Erythroxylum novogranatense TaxID=1862640 RepID=A0AAV8TNX9_9ROSI|nr:hypothetical protein K2173_020799 [Erythroxylum novogranatense]
MVVCGQLRTWDSFHGGDQTLSRLPLDILQTRIFTLLDGPTLASTSCVATDLRALSADETLWRNICRSIWPSVNDLRVSGVVSTFAAGHRTLFSDSYPLLHHKRNSNLNDQMITTTRLISAVDIYYQNVPIFSKVVETETVTDWFFCSPFGIGLLEPREYEQRRERHEVGVKWLKQLEENMRLSWKMIDPELRRAVNVSSDRPVSVKKHWLTGEVEVKFATVVDGIGGPVKWEVVLTCGGKEGGETEMTELSMGVEDMEGKRLNGRDSLVILQSAMERGERRRARFGVERQRYEEFVEKRRVWREEKQRRESAADMLFVVVWVTLFISFLRFVMFR